MDATANAALVRAFCAGRDAPCPRCGYNLRDLAGDACPECGRVVDLEIRRDPQGGLLGVVATAGLTTSVLAIPVNLVVPSLVAASSYGLMSWFMYPIWIGATLATVAALVVVLVRRLRRRGDAGLTAIALLVWIVTASSLGRLLVTLAFWAVS